MAPENRDQPAPDAGPPAEPQQCSACRGTGKVISNLGGERKLVTCPWCEGGGVRIAGHNAQQRDGSQPAADAADADRDRVTNGGDDGGPDMAA